MPQMVLKRIAMILLLAIIAIYQTWRISNQVTTGRPDLSHFPRREDAPLSFWSTIFVQMLGVLVVVLVVIYLVVSWIFPHLRFLG